MRFFGVEPNLVELADAKSTLKSKTPVGAPGHAGGGRETSELVTARTRQLDPRNRPHRVSKVALAMHLDGDQSALRAYHAGGRNDPRVIHYFEREGLGFLIVEAAD